MLNHHTKINKIKAFKMFVNHEPFYMNPCKLVAFGPWHTECLINPGDYIRDYAISHGYDYNTLSESSHPEVYKQAFESMYNNWSYYNTNYEMGYYAHFYTV